MKNLENSNKEKKSRRRTIIKDTKLNLNAGGVASPVNLKPPANDPGHTIYVKPAGERQVVNIVSILINEQLGAALERFNACACPKCCHEITCRVLNEVEPMFVHVSTINDAHDVNNKLSRLRPSVIKVLTKFVMAGKLKPYHSL
jgi:hypothetical protein